MIILLILSIVLGVFGGSLLRVIVTGRDRSMMTFISLCVYGGLSTFCLFGFVSQTFLLSPILILLWTLGGSAAIHGLIAASPFRLF
ncbi:MAG: hypothetical protein UW68_C0016G0015 [Candidatus Collierbacteria bacterium GW2011_GWB1_44_6]|uniref:Uncharacterized protein n=2 Tax=Candidatus Collieribacteriota TaxID=1752725 RepID=A0A0G1JP57_9BACT|nr:MAG: hypothetical protein UV68_C0017G0018 [Candidatus Collierbacteria bacterium GW2011_GWC2_43_12]KKT73135.1 MAG: hypothetical protein UW68_C0016G0015 [Candidatus Collierbacteria bacterium GW2011_GWB1_44_6]KKT82972.1 MAG: hypothetical protein UW80_C0025G0005 [Microgenomates group bacterium GW2011_GWC1_44_9]